MILTVPCALICWLSVSISFEENNRACLSKRYSKAEPSGNDGQWLRVKADCIQKALTARG